MVNEPTPGAPTDKQMAATVQSVDAQQGGCTLQPPGQEVLVGRFAEGRLELSTEVGRGQARDSGQVGHGKRLEVPGVCEVFGSEQMAGDRGGWHGADSAGSTPPDADDGRLTSPEVRDPQPDGLPFVSWQVSPP